MRLKIEEEVERESEEGNGDCSAMESIERVKRGVK